MDDFTPLEGNIGLDDLNILGLFKGITSGGLGKKKKDRLFRKDDEGKDTDEMTLEGFMDSLGKIDGGRDTFFNLVKRLDPMNFYKVTGMPQTTGGLEEMAGAKLEVAEPGKKLTKEQQKYNNQVFEARRLVQDKKGQSQQGGA